MIDLTNCKNGNHTLIEIYSRGYDDMDVIRWCSICGSIVVDVDYDNRTYPGKIVPMKQLELFYDNK